MDEDELVVAEQAPVVDAAATAASVMKAARRIQKELEGGDDDQVSREELTQTIQDALSAFRSLAWDAAGGHADLTERVLELPADAAGDTLEALLARTVTRVNNDVQASVALLEKDDADMDVDEPSSNAAAGGGRKGFRDAYMELITREFGMELNQLRQTEDFEQPGKIAMLVEALESGAALFSTADQAALTSSVRSSAPSTKKSV